MQDWTEFEQHWTEYDVIYVDGSGSATIDLPGVERKRIVAHIQTVFHGLAWSSDSSGVSNLLRPGNGGGANLTKVFEHLNDLRTTVGTIRRKDPSALHVLFLADDELEADRHGHDCIRYNLPIDVMTFAEFLAVADADASVLPPQEPSPMRTRRPRPPETRRESRTSEFNLTEDNFLIDVMINEGMANHDVAVVRGKAQLGDVELLITGSARRDPRDHPDPELGLTLATARALYSLARQVERRAQGRIKHNDDMAADRARRAKEPKKPIPKQRKPRTHKPRTDPTPIVDELDITRVHRAESSLWSAPVSSTSKKLSKRLRRAEKLQERGASGSTS